MTVCHFLFSCVLCFCFFEAVPLNELNHLNHLTIAALTNVPIAQNHNMVQIVQFVQLIASPRQW